MKQIEVSKQPTFSVLRHNQEFLIIKNADGKPFVFAVCFIEAIAESLCDLLNQQTEINNSEK